MSVRVNASGDLIIRSASGPNVTITDAYTFMVWVKVISDRNDYGAVIAIGDTSAYVIGPGADGLSLIFYNNSSETDSGQDLVVGTWHHIAFTHPAVSGICRVYLDGVEVISNTNFNAITGSKFQFGNDDFTEWMDAEFRGGRSWQAELTITEVNSERASATPVKAGGWAHWELDNTSTGGDDTTGNARPLTLTNLSNGASDPSIYAPASSFPPVPKPFTSMHTLVAM